MTYNIIFVVPVKGYAGICGMGLEVCDEKTVITRPGGPCKNVWLIVAGSCRKRPKVALIAAV
jgi:hypothetical protein